HRRSSRTPLPSCSTTLLGSPRCGQAAASTSSASILPSDSARFSPRSSNMRLLFTTLQTYESDFYGRVGAELIRRGHEVSHVTVSRRAARPLREPGFQAHCLPHPAREARPPTAPCETGG